MEPAQSERGWAPGRRSVVAWVLYDLANTTFALGVGSRYFGLWLIEDQGGADWQLSATIIVAMIAVIVLGPWIGALSDHHGTRRPYLVVSTLLCVAATAVLATWGIVPSLVFYALGTIGFHSGAVVYDAMLPDVSTPERAGRISGVGVAVGYLGSALALGIGAAWASDRVFMTRLAPEHLLGEFFGLYATVGRFATVLGPLAWALVADGLGWGRTAALAFLGVFIVAARVVLQGVDDRRGDARVLDHRIS